MRFAAFLAALPLVLAAPILEARADTEKIPGRFIVVLKQDTSDSAFASTLASVTSILGAEPKYKYNLGTFKGFSVGASDALLQTVANLGAVEFIEPDTVVRASALVTQQNPPYGLARISHRNPGATTYVYDESAGEGILVYGIDTGVFCGHEDFGGRCTDGASFVDEPAGDMNGHGTHTAATAAGTKYGVAKKATVIGVKVLSGAGSGSNAGVIAGIEWAANDAVSRGKANKAVGNLSLGGPRLGEASNRAVAAAVAKGLFLSVAAGNSMAPTLAFTPASEPSACTVGATDSKDGFASFSNFGPGTDILAPGVNVTSAWIRSPTDTNTISGTSMAAPHVAGLGAYLLALEGPRSPIALCDRIIALSTKGKIRGLQTLLGVTPNRLAFNGATA